MKKIILITLVFGSIANAINFENRQIYATIGDIESNTKGKELTLLERDFCRL